MLRRRWGTPSPTAGPDAEGFWSEPGVGLVHRRLSIIDLAGGDQPIANEDGSLQVVFNGEIYNFQELRRGLEARGHRFRTHSDTEVLVHLYEEHGERLVERLRGMFAFALWDRPRRRLLLARDRLGIKPLYVYRDAEKLLFASELKAILAYPGVPAAVDPAALEDYLAFGMVPGRRSIFRGVEKLPPGHTLAGRRPTGSAAEPRRYWQLRLEAGRVAHGGAVAGGDPRQARRGGAAAPHRRRAGRRLPQRRHRLQHRRRLGGRPDRGAAPDVLHRLSRGGVQRAAVRPRRWPGSSARGTSRRSSRPTPSRLVDELTHYFDEPFADSSAMPTYLVSRLAGGSVKVVLSGDGGDEAFGGYARYAHDLKEAASAAGCRAGSGAASSGRWRAAWPKADWLPRALRAKTALTNLSLDAAGAPTPTRCRCAARRCAAGCWPATWRRG